MSDMVHHGLSGHSVGPLEDQCCICLRLKIGKLERRCARYREAIQKALMRLGAPTMGYEPSVELRELKDSNKEASRVLLKILSEGGEKP